MQNEVTRFMLDCPQPMDIQSCVNDIISEVGELAKEINIANSWGLYRQSYNFRPNARKELGQILFAVYQLATQMGIDGDDALAEVLVDFRERYTKQGHTGSSNYL